MLRAGVPCTRRRDAPGRLQVRGHPAAGHGQGPASWRATSTSVASRAACTRRGRRTTGCGSALCTRCGSGPSPWSAGSPFTTCATRRAACSSCPACRWRSSRRCSATRTRRSLPGSTVISSCSTSGRPSPRRGSCRRNCSPRRQPSRTEPHGAHQVTSRLVPIWYRRWWETKEGPGPPGRKPFRFRPLVWRRETGFEPATLSLGS